MRGHRSTPDVSSADTATGERGEPERVELVIVTPTALGVASSLLVVVALAAARGGTRRFAHVASIGPVPLVRVRLQYGPYTSTLPSDLARVVALSLTVDRFSNRGANMTNFIDPEVPPSGTGCVECLESGGWWFHLRRCAGCGHIGCCDNSPSQHATAHADSSGHPVIRSFEPGEDWFWNYRTNEYIEGPHLAPPQHHPLNQPVPGPAGRVPANWQDLLVET